MSGLPPGVDWLPVDTVLEDLRARCSTVVAIETVRLGEAAGRLLAAPIWAARAHPPLSNAALDGFAVAARDDDEPVPLDAVRAVPGRPPVMLRPGHACPILTGAPLPLGATAVVGQERAEATDEAVHLPPTAAGDNVRPAGEDVAAGALALDAGTRLHPGAMALAAAVGTAEVTVRARLRVGILSTGNELVGPGVAADHQVYDANGPMLDAMLRGWGHVPVALGRVGDRPEVIAAALDSAPCDAILTSGGASAGAEDHLAAVLRSEGRLDAWRVALKPGRPFALGRWGPAPVFALPGNPVAAFVCAALFARPALSVLAGGPWSGWPTQELPAAFCRPKRPGRTDVLRVRREAAGLAPYPSEGSGRIASLAWADGLATLPHSMGNVTDGQGVLYTSLTDLLAPPLVT